MEDCSTAEIFRYVSATSVRRFTHHKRPLGRLAVSLYMIQIFQFHQSFPCAGSALVTDVTNGEHTEADDVTRGGCGTLQLPEYNDPSLNVMILTLCGISL